MSFSERLKELRSSRGLTQKQVAEAVNMAPMAYQKYEYGTREPAHKYLIALANYFEVPLDYLTGRSDSLKELCDKCGTEMVLALMDGSFALDGSVTLSGYYCPNCSKDKPKS